MRAKFKTYALEADAIADREHLRKLAVAAGHKYPETPDMLKRGSRARTGVNRIPDEKMLADYPTEYYKHPTKKEWMTVVNDFVAAQQGKVDQATLHAIDVSTATDELDWYPDPVAATMEPIP